MNTPDSTLVQQAAFGAIAAAYVAGMRDTEFIAFAVLCAVAIISDALIRRGRAGVAEAAQYVKAAASEDE